MKGFIFVKFNKFGGKYIICERFCIKFNFVIFYICVRVNKIKLMISVWLNVVLKVNIILVKMNREIII